MKDTSILAISTLTHRLGDECQIMHRQHVRVYGYAPGVMSLQIRSEGGILGSGRGKSYKCYSDAHIDLEGALAVRAALTAWIDEQRVAS